MNITFFIVFGLAFLSFIIPATIYGMISRRSIFNRSGMSNSAFLPIFLILLPLTLGSRFFLYNADDFIGSFGFLQIIIPFFGAFAIFASGYFTALHRWFWPLLVSAVVLAIISMPAEAVLVIPSLSPLVNRLILAAAWLFFAVLYPYVNSGDGILSLQSLNISLGIGILGAINALPLLLGIYGWMFAAAFLALTVFSWHPSRIKISSADAAAFGFLLFSLIAPASGEGAASCCLIFSLFFLIDFCWSLALKLTFFPRYKDLSANSGFRQATADGMEPAQAASFTFRIQMLMLLFGCFQAYSPTPWSLLLVSVMVTLWLDYRFRNIPAQPQSLRNINAQVLEELQDRVNEFKSYIKKDNDI